MFYSCLFFFLLSFFILPFETLAQSKEAEFARLYPESKAIFLQRNKKIYIDFKNEKISIRTVYFSEILHLKLHSGDLATESVRFSQFMKITNLNAYTLAPNKKSYKKLVVKNFTKQDIISEDVFYNDEKEITFTYPSIEPMAKTVLSYEEEILDPHFLGGFYFTSYLPTVSAKVEVFVHKDITLGYKIFNDKNINFNIRNAGKYQVYSWETPNTAVFESYENSPNMPFYEPHIWFHVKMLKIKGKYVNFLSSVADLYLWYYEFIRHADENKNNSLKILADSLTKNVKTENQKAKKIYEWVQSNIKYVAFEQGLRGFTPEIAETVYQKRYGDCKDMSSMLVALLRWSGIRAHFAWIGSRDLPYRYDELPTPAIDDHMIVVAFLDDKIYFLDGTSSYTPFGMPTAFIQGKEALVAIDDKNYQILQVPVMRSNQNVILDSVVINLEGNKMKAQGKYSLKGYPKVLLTEYIAENSDNQEKSTKRLLQGENKFLDSLRFDFENFEDNDKPLLLNYYYEAANYHKIGNGEIYINMHLIPLWKSNFINITRKSQVETKYHFEQKSIIKLQIPAGYRLGAMPENMAFSDADFSFEMSYFLEQNALVMEMKVRSAYLLLETTKFDTWNKMIEKINKAYKQSVILVN